MIRTPKQNLRKPKTNIILPNRLKYRKVLLLRKDMEIEDLVNMAKPTERELEEIVTRAIPEPIKGDDGITPTEEEIIALIEPRIPAPIKGEKGENGKDGKSPTKTEIKSIIREVLPEEKIVEKVLKKVKPWDKGDKGEKWDKGDTIRFADLTAYEKQILTWPPWSTWVWVPRYGTTGQVLAKRSSKDFDTEWVTWGGGGSVDSVVAGTWITVDATDPANPIVATTITQYTDELAQDAVWTIMTDSAEIDFTYNDGTPSITASIVAWSIDESKLDTSVNASLDLADTAVQPAWLSGYQLTSQKDSANGYAGLDAGGKINSAQIPDIGLSQFLGNFTDTTAALANAWVQASQIGDWFTVDTSGGQSWIVTTSLPTTLADITQLKTPTDAVTSVFSRTGAVTAQNGDYTASNITNVPAGTIAAVTVQAALDELDSEKQATLVSGTNIKTVNSTTLLGSGDLAVATTAQGALADSALQPWDIASGTITARADDINFSGGIDGDVLTVQADGSLALETLGGGSGTVTSVAISGSDWLEVDSGSPITTSGTIALWVNKTALLAHINVEDWADVTDATNVNAAGAVMNSDYTPAHSILVQQSGTGSPTIVQIPNSTIVWRIAWGWSDIDALTASEVRTIINVEDGADVTDATNVAAAGAFMKSVDDTDDITDTATNRFTDDTAITRLANTSGTNTGDQTITNSSDATSHTVTLSASGGSVQLIEGSGITLTTWGTASAGTVTVASSGGSGATTALDNLASVAINTSLVSDTDNTDDLGTTLKKWANLFVTTIGATATRVTKWWFTDLEVTNAITGSITGNSATTTTNANLTWPVTSVGNATAIADSALSIAKTSGLQTALDAKAPLASPTFTGTVILPKTLEIQDTSADHQYVLAVSELTADRTITLPLLAASDTFVFANFIQTLTNKRITQRVVTTTDDATAVIDIDVTDVYELSAVANNTTFTITGTPTDWQKLIVRYKDAGVSKTLTWTGFTALGITLPTATTASKWSYVGFIYNSAATQWHGVSVVTQA